MRTRLRFGERKRVSERERERERERQGARRKSRRIKEIGREIKERDRREPILHKYKVV